MTKKILLIIGIVAVIGIAAFLIFSSRQAAINGGGNGFDFSITKYLPFGNSSDENNLAPAASDNEATSTPQINTANEPVPRLRKLSGEPAAGAVIFSAGTTSVVRFVEKGTGNVYEARSDSNLVQRLTNTTIPKIVRAFWLPNGSGFLAQTLMPDSEIIETSFVKLVKNSGTSSGTETLTPFGTKISKLPTGIKEIAVKPDSSKIFYYTVSGSSSLWFTSNPDGTSAIQVYSSPLTEWLPAWNSGNLIGMQTKESANLPAYTYSFDFVGKTLKNAGQTKTGILPKLNTLAEKCAASKTKNIIYCAIPDYWPSGNYPDDWYQGAVSTDDSIEKVDTANEIFYNIADISRISGQNTDVADIALSPDNTHVIFRNKIDSSLWMLRIAE